MLSPAVAACGSLNKKLSIKQQAQLGEQQSAGMNGNQNQAVSILLLFFSLAADKFAPMQTKSEPRFVPEF